MGSESAKAKPSRPMLVVAAIGLVLGVVFVVAACQSQWGWAARSEGGYQKDGMNVSDYPLDEAFIAEMIAKRPDSFEYPYAYMSADGPESVQVPEVLEMGGVRYELRGVAEPQVDESWERPVKSASALVTKSVPASDIGNASRYFPAEIEYAQDGFAGVLARGSQVSSQPENEVLTRQVDRTVSYTGLASNDASTLPQSRAFEVSSADGVVTKELQLSDVSYQVESAAPDGTPASYSAIANYRGVEEYLTTPGYAITYAYGGSVELVDTQMVVKATYDAVLPWGEALVGIVAFGPVSELAEALSMRCS